MSQRSHPTAIADDAGHLWTRELRVVDRGNVITSVTPHKDGYLIADCRVARVGTQTYRGHEVGLPDRDVVTLYRPPEEVFARDSMHSHANKPVTLTHPARMVDSKTWGKVAKGFSGNDVVRDGDYVRVPLMLTDAKAIEAYNSGAARELSVGYTTDIDWTAGHTPSGEPYDGVQRAIRTNHHALVPVARGGDRLRFGDASSLQAREAAAEAQNAVRQWADAMPGKFVCNDCGSGLADDDHACPTCGADTTGNKTWASGDDDDEELLPDAWKQNAADAATARSIQMPVQKMFDGVPIHFVDDVSAGAMSAYIVRLIADAAAVKDAITKKSGDDADAEKARQAKEQSMGDAIAAKDGEIAVLKKQIADAVTTDDVVSARAHELLGVWDAAKPFLAKDAKFEGQTSGTIRRAVVSAKLGDAAVKDWDDAKIGGAFHALVATGATAKGGAQKLADGLSKGITAGGGHTNGTSLADARAVRDAAYEEMKQRNADAHKHPNGEVRH